MAREGINNSEASSLDFSGDKEEGQDMICECECGAGCSESLSHFAFTMEMDDGEGAGGSGGARRQTLACFCSLELRADDEAMPVSFIQGDQGLPKGGGELLWGELQGSVKKKQQSLNKH